MKIYAYRFELFDFQPDPDKDRLLDKFVGKDLWFYAEDYGWVKLLKKYTVYNTMLEDDVPYYRFYCINPNIAKLLDTQGLDYRKRILGLLPNDERSVPIYFVDKWWYPAMQHGEILTTDELFRLGEP